MGVSAPTFPDDFLAQLENFLVLRGVSDSVVRKLWRNTLSSWDLAVKTTWIFTPNCTIYLDPVRGKDQ